MYKKTLMLLLVGMVSVSSYALWATPASAQTPHVVSTTPAQNALNVPLSTDISVTFDIDMDEEGALECQTIGMAVDFIAPYVSDK